MASTDATPNPVKNQAFRFTFPIHKNDGTLITGATGLDSEVSKDAGTQSDCTNEATEIATSTGVYYLDLTATEMNADTVAVTVKTSSTSAVIDTYVFYPWSTGKVQVQLEGITHTSATIPTVTTTTTATNVTTVNGLAANVITATAINSGAITSAKFAASAIDATAIASNAITSAKIASGAITTATFAAGAIDAAAIAADAIGSSELAASAATEIGTAVWATTTRELSAFNLDAGLTAAAVQMIMDWNVANLVTPESYGAYVLTIASLVWEELRASHTTAGTMGEGPAQIISGTATGTPTTTTMPASALTSRADNQYNLPNPRSIIWTSGVLTGVRAVITGYTNSTRTLTFSAVPTAPTAGDKFLIL